MDDTELQLLAESIGPPAKFDEMARREASFIFTTLQTKQSLHSQKYYTMDRPKILGGLEKKTSTCIKVICINDFMIMHRITYWK